jgi:hypothetical protein
VQNQNRTLWQGYSNLEENFAQIKLEVVGRLYCKKITTSKRILLEKNYKFLGDLLNSKENASYRKVKRIQTCHKVSPHFCIVVFTFEKMFPYLCVVSNTLP